MQIILVNQLTSELETVEVESRTDFETFEMIVASCVNIDPIEFVILKDGQIITGAPNACISSLNLQDGDLLAVSKKASVAFRSHPSAAATTQPKIDFSSINVASLFNGVRTAAATGSNGQFVAAQDPAVEARMKEKLRLNNINAQLQMAMEYNPQSFTKTTMLYIACKVNKNDVKAFVDSGAQMTFMSLNLARQCQVDHLIDHRFSGEARGVGTQKILGRVHCIQLEISGIFLQLSVSVMEDQQMDLLIGLDMLKQYQCDISLSRNALQIGSFNVETPFLPENQLPDHAKLSNVNANVDEAKSQI